MKKVLFVVTALEMGGIENYLLRFLKYSNNKIDGTVFCKAGRTGALEDEYKEYASHIEVLRLGYFSFLDYMSFYKYLQREKFDVVCDFTGDFSGLVLFISYLAGVEKRLAFYRNSMYNFKKTYMKCTYAKLMKYLTKEYATKILSNSYAALDVFHQTQTVKQDIFSVIYNGIPQYKKISQEDIKHIREVLGIPLGAFLIGHIGRYDPRKNHVQVLRIAEILVKEYDNVYFLLCGPGVKDNLSKNIEQMHVDSKIRLDNSRDDVWAILQSLDAFYFPSLSEGQPNALLEAMSVGLPFVASDIDSIKEAVSLKYNKYLTAPNDIENTVELFRDFIEKRSNFSSYELSEWTKNTYDSDRLFDKFYQEL